MHQFDTSVYVVCCCLWTRLIYKMRPLSNSGL